MEHDFDKRGICRHCGTTFAAYLIEDYPCEPQRNRSALERGSGSPKPTATAADAAPLASAAQSLVGGVMPTASLTTAAGVV